MSAPAWLPLLDARHAPLVKPSTGITVTDLFCGGGGSSLGAEWAGATVVMCANHWATAIQVHQAWFPHAGHDLADISQADPRRYPVTDILMGSPECFTAGHLVLTQRGQVPIEDVRVGDMALTHLGRWRPVVRTQVRTKDTVVVKGQGHTGIETTATHRFWAMSSHRRWHNHLRDYRRVYETPDWIEAEQLVDKTALWSTPVEFGKLDAVAPPPAFGEGPNAWWLLGRWLGDGSLTFGRNHEVLLACGFHEADEIRTRLAATGRTWGESTKRTSTVFYLGDRESRDWLAEHCGHGAAEKQVPVQVLGMHPGARREVLEGYLSADGSKNDRGRVRCSTVSRKLAISVRLLAESLGHRVAMAQDKRTTYSIEGRTGAAQPQWVLHWEAQLAHRRQPEAFVLYGQAWSRVRKVLPGRAAQQVYNIEVDEDHSYVLDGIVVKNCTNHSQARGVRRSAQLDIGADPAAERSRATMWDMLRFAEQIPYKAVIVENVVDATKWIFWPMWWAGFEALGYEGRVVCHNSMDHGVPQSRDRIYVVWTRKGLRPDLEMEREAYCPRCDTARTVRQAWKHERRIGRYRQAWEWSCTTCSTICRPPTEPAASIIDWDLPIDTVGERTKPLARNTRDRIYAGLERHGWVPVTTTGAGNTHERTPGNRARTLFDVLPVQQTTATSALAVPPGFLFQTAHGGRVTDLDRPHPTVCASDDRQSLVVRPGSFLMRNNRGLGEMVTPTSEPARTMTTAGHQSLLMAAPPDESWTRDETVDRCGFRMLAPTEVAAAMAFPDGYLPTSLPKTDRVKLAGNAVCPPNMAWIMGRIVRALEEAA